MQESCRPHLRMDVAAKAALPNVTPPDDKVGETLLSYAGHCALVYHQLTLVTFDSTPVVQWGRLAFTIIKTPAWVTMETSGIHQRFAELHGHPSQRARMLFDTDMLRPVAVVGTPSAPT